MSDLVPTDLIDKAMKIAKAIVVAVLIGIFCVGWYCGKH